MVHSISSLRKTIGQIKENCGLDNISSEVFLCRNQQIITPSDIISVRHILTSSNSFRPDASCRGCRKCSYALCKNSLTHEIIHTPKRPTLLLLSYLILLLSYFTCYPTLLLQRLFVGAKTALPRDLDYVLLGPVRFNSGG